MIATICYFQVEQAHMESGHLDAAQEPGLADSDAFMQGKPRLDAVSSNPEANNLLTAMLHSNPKQRPSMQAVMAHPFWWNPDRRLAFLLHVSDRVELEDREVGPHAIAACRKCMYVGAPAQQSRRIQTGALIC